MRASARVVAEADGCGGTRLAVLLGESPLLLRRTGPRRAGRGVTVHLVGGAAGPLRGDDLRLEVSVGPGAWLDVHSVAASLALPGRDGAPPSRLRIDAVVAAGAVLRWWPEPLIAAAGCDHRAITHVEVAEGASLLWRDDLVCGRHGEGAGDVRMDTTIRYAGRTLYRHELAIGPAAPGWSGAAVLGGGRAVGSVVLAGPAFAPPGEAAAGLALLGGDAASSPRLSGAAANSPRLSGAAASSPRLSGAAARATVLSGQATSAAVLHGDAASAAVLSGDAAVMPLAGPGTLATAVGPDIRQVRAALDPICGGRPADASAEPEPDLQTATT